MDKVKDKKLGLILFRNIRDNTVLVSTSKNLQDRSVTSKLLRQIPDKKLRPLSLHEDSRALRRLDLWHPAVIVTGFKAPQHVVNAYGIMQLTPNRLENVEPDRIVNMDRVLETRFGGKYQKFITPRMYLNHSLNTNANTDTNNTGSTNTNTSTSVLENASKIPLVRPVRYVELPKEKKLEYQKSLFLRAKIDQLCRLFVYWEHKYASNTNFDLSSYTCYWEHNSFKDLVHENIQWPSKLTHKQLDLFRGNMILNPDLKNLL
ncbi:hypothetical protein AX774_g2628 [Zancudomyces culisetae]|uniref:Uncharacterized protein n=1 Tax=Zancudomyces culisetae TaxID=1213189 RepID=A0A1R1PSA2_ZANCU|nr:hypothetical protein AX774_g2628 [Zancudomyces culisetae]|eukprot:OMH83847.1 hypothetical protein AX774_g2628 [Zancudomyces culisetae]